MVQQQKAYEHSNLKLSATVEREMSDGLWLAKQQLMKPVQLSQVDWSTSQNRNTDIYSVNFPSVLNNVDSIFTRTLRMYAYYKLSPCFRVQINTTQFHQGQLICSFDPFSQSSRNTNSNIGFDHFYATGLPNIKIMASESDAVELMIPFIHPRSYLTTNQTGVFNNLGAFRITVLNPLVVAEGTSSTVSVTIWAYAKDAQVHVPIQDHNPILDSNSVEATSFEFGRHMFEDLFSNISNNASSTFKSITRGVKQSHTIIGNVVSGNFGQALRTGQGLIDTLGDLFGFDYPSRTLQPPKTISPIENLSIGIGQSQSQRMAIDPFSLYTPENSIIGESIHSMNLLSIAKMPMLLSQISFPSTAARDSQIFTTPITPTISAYFGGNFRRTYLSFISNAFCYWNGGINFDIEVVATRFHSGKLLFAFVPNTQIIPSYTSAASSLPNVVVDIQQTSSVRFKIPYVSSTVLKNVQRYNPAYNPDLSYDDDTNFIDSSIGTLVCYVQNTLTYASNVAPNIELNIYISAGDDFSLYVPAKPFKNLVGTPPQVESTSNNIGLTLNKNDETPTPTVLSKDQDSIKTRPLFGESYSLIDIIRRFTYYKRFDMEAGENIMYVTPQYDLAFDNNESCPYICYFSQIYSAFSGSLRYKFVSNSTRSDNIQFNIVHIPDTSAGLSTRQVDNINDFQGFGTLATSACQDTTIEAEIPYYSKFNMLLLASSNLVNDLDVNYNGFVAMNYRKPEGFSLFVDTYIAAGEDFRFIYIRPPPNDSTNVGYKLTTLT